MTEASPSFVFKGRVKRATPRGTALVTVDEILEGTGHLNDLVGQTVEVQLDKGDKGARVAVGDHGVFHTVPVSFGETVIVRSIKQARAASSDLAGHVAQADLAISGRVESVHDVDDQSGPITEHAPQWREAIVKVSDVQKGRHAPPTIAVRFPASTDVRWVDAPKLEVGHEGVFLLHKTTGTGAKRRAAYAVLHSADVQPIGRADEIKRLAGRRGSS